MKDVPVDSGVNLRDVSRRLVGYSGADVTSVCRDAAMMSMRRRIAGLDPHEIRQLPKEELELPITKDDFVEAIKKTSKSVSAEDLEKYAVWMKEYGST